MYSHQISTFFSTTSYCFLKGADDLKGKILQHRGGPGRKAGESDILMNLFILVRQAEHEMKNGDPNVCSNSIIYNQC